MEGAKPLVKNTNNVHQQPEQRAGRSQRPQPAPRRVEEALMPALICARAGNSAAKSNIINNKQSLFFQPARSPKLVAFLVLHARLEMHCIRLTVEVLGIRRQQRRRQLARSLAPRKQASRQGQTADAQPDCAPNIYLVGRLRCSSRSAASSLAPARRPR